MLHALPQVQGHELSIGQASFTSKAQEVLNVENDDVRNATSLVGESLCPLGLPCAVTKKDTMTAAECRANPLGLYRRSKGLSNNGTDNRVKPSAVNQNDEMMFYYAFFHRLKWRGRDIMLPFNRSRKLLEWHPIG